MKPGIYDDKNNLIKSWDELIEEGLEVSSNYNFFDALRNQHSGFSIISKYNPSKIIFSDNITKIGNNAFATCASLKEIVLGKRIKTVGADAFSNCRNLETVSFNENLEYLETQSFSWCTSLKSIGLPHKLRAIENKAFYKCDSLKEVYIPESVNFIINTAFIECKSLEKIEVSFKNKRYTSIDGVLFDKNIESLLTYPMNKKGDEYFVPKGIANICGNAFLLNKYLKKVSLPDTIKFIGAQAFSGTKIENIYIPDSVGRIDSYAFADCKNLKSIRLPDDALLKNYIFSMTNLEEIVVSKNFPDKHCDFVRENKNLIKIQKSLDELLDEGKSFKETIAALKNNLYTKELER